MSARRAAGPSFEMLRMRASGIRTTSWIAIRAFPLSGAVGEDVTASKNEARFSAVKMMPEETKPIWEMVMDPRIRPLSLGPPIAAPNSP